MSEANSPTFLQGQVDGERDNDLIGQCPPAPPIGPEPPFPDYPTMYMRGYMSTYVGEPHRCTNACRQRRGNNGR